MMVRATVQTVALAAILGALLFGFSGDPLWVEAWIFIATLAVIGIATSSWLMARDPALLRARLSSPVSADQAPAVRTLVAAVGLGFFIWIAAIGLDHRFHGRRLPVWAEGIGVVLMAVGIALVCWTFAANSFAAPQVRIQAERAQTVIDTGPYRFIRHPMCAGGDLYLVGIALLLGSVWGLIGAVALILEIFWRAVGEEKVLRDGLVGYEEYARRVRYRIVPGIWKRPSTRL